MNMQRQWATKFWASLIWVTGLCASLIGLGALTSAFAACPGVPGDVNGDGIASVTDAQCTILGSLWGLGGSSGAPPACLGGNPSAADLNCDGAINVVDVVTIIAIVLGMPLDPQIDANGNQCVDACEVPGGYQLQHAEIVPMGAPELSSPNYRALHVKGRWAQVPGGETASTNYKIVLE